MSIRRSWRNGMFCFTREEKAGFSFYFHAKQILTWRTSRDRNVNNYLLFVIRKRSVPFDESVIDKSLVWKKKINCNRDTREEFDSSLKKIAFFSLLIII